MKAIFRHTKIAREVGAEHQIWYNAWLRPPGTRVTNPRLARAYSTGGLECDERASAWNCLLIKMKILDRNNVFVSVWILECATSENCSDTDEVRFKDAFSASQRSSSLWVGNLRYLLDITIECSCQLDSIFKTLSLVLHTRLMRPAGRNRCHVSRFVARTARRAIISRLTKSVRAGSIPAD